MADKTTTAVVVPEWRRNAPAGVSLAAARSLRTATNSEDGRVGDASLPAELGRIIRPEAQARWVLPSVALITPQYLEAILRGALVGNHVFQWQLFDLMEDTWPRLVKNLNELKRSAIRELTQHWRLQAWCAKKEAPTLEAEQRTQLVQEALLGMKGNPTRNENGFRDTVYDLLDAWAKGVSLLEIQWGARENGELGAILAPRSTYWVHPSNYGWDNEGNLGLVLTDQVRSPNVGPFARMDAFPSQVRGSGTNLEPLVEDKFLVAICRARTGHPLGGALLRPLAWWWCAANFSADWLLNYAQIFGLPIRWASYAPGSPQNTIDQICEMLENMGAAGWAAFPAGTQLELKEASKGGNELPQAMVLDRADKQCDLLILGQTLTTDVQDSGSRALGEVHEGVRNDVIDGAVEFAAEVLNTQAVPSILRLNFGDEEMAPKFVRNEEEPKKAEANAKVIEIAVRSGVPVPVSYALEKLNIPKAEEGEEIVKAPTPAPAAGMEEGGRPKSEGRSPKEHDEQDEEARQAAMRATAADRLTENVLEDLTGVQARWLGSVKPYFRRLCAAALSDQVSDEEFVQVLERSRREMPELFAKLDHRALAVALEKAMTTGFVNGAVKGWMKRSKTTDQGR